MRGSGFFACNKQLETECPCFISHYVLKLASEHLLLSLEAFSCCTECSSMSWGDYYLFGGCEASLWALAEDLDGILRGALIWINPVLG